MRWAFAYQNGGSHLESNWKFQRGDIYFVKLEAGVGSEQNGARPAVILQNDVGNIYSPTLIVAALTSKTDKLLFLFLSLKLKVRSVDTSWQRLVLFQRLRVTTFQVLNIKPRNMVRVLTI